MKGSQKPLAQAVESMLMLVLANDETKINYLSDRMDYKCLKMPDVDIRQ